MKKLIAFAAASLLVPAAAAAAPVAANPPAKGKVLLLTPLTLTKLSDLHFGTIITSPTAGTVTVPADGSAPSASGGVTMVASDPPVLAYFAGAGSVGQDVIIAVTNPGTLSDGLGNTVTVVSLDIEGSTTKTIDASHAFFFHVGGTIQVGADQADGLYQSNFDVTADYQ
ncbi:DUF4402 domain-containing protein [Sphingomonas jaspsi]|uniref:DUF4402 domain-containing protein n=1 Tax=Sphingomonas jaspsi TaxID=392409 RepID=UPI0004AFB76E|nr:DUF4402 domain-containing protein [Sphingomonas jaspsi]